MSYTMDDWRAVRVARAVLRLRFMRFFPELAFSALTVDTECAKVS